MNRKQRKQRRLMSRRVIQENPETIEEDTLAELIELVRQTEGDEVANRLHTVRDKKDGAVRIRLMDGEREIVTFKIGRVPFEDASLSDHSAPT